MAFPEKNPWNWKRKLTFLFDRRLTECLTKLTNLIQIRYLGPLQISRVINFVFDLPIFSKMAPTKLIKFCGFTVHSKPNSVTLSAYPEKIPETGKKIISLCDRRLTKRLTLLINIVQIRYPGPPWKYLHSLFFFRLTVKIKGSSHKKKINI